MSFGQIRHTAEALSDADRTMIAGYLGEGGVARMQAEMHQVEKAGFPKFDFLNSFRLRSAYGANGVQPQATAALQTFAAGTTTMSSRHQMLSRNVRQRWPQLALASRG